MSLGPVMLDVTGTQLTDDDRKRLMHPLVGGVILFSRNFSTRKQLNALTAEIHRLRTPPLLIAVDHEGGRVQRFKEEFTRLPAMRALGRIWDKNQQQVRQLAQQVGFVMAAELRVSGIDLSFAPVLDIDYGESSVIGDRAFHRDPQAISDLAHDLMLGLRSAGMQAVGKHFPGHGFIRADSHLEKSVDQRRYVDIELADMLPFQRMIDYGLGAIMAAHVIYPQVDRYPAGFSHVWLNEILRQKLQFDGCIFSDDLSMQGAAHFKSITERAEAALKAGCDMVLVCNDAPAVDELLNTLQWKSTAVSLARLARMHGKKQFTSMTQLRADVNYISALRAIGAVGESSAALPFDVP